MAWRDNLRPASFRGVPFHVVSDDHTTGRRLVEHVHPETDGLTPEDLGRQVRRWRVQAFLVGADYMAERDALLAALEEPGAATLVHPYYGDRIVRATGEVSTRTSSRQGGVCEVSFVCVETAEKDVRPVATADTQAAVATAADAAETDALTAFQEAFEAASSQPQFAIDTLAGDIDAVFNAVRVVTMPLQVVRSVADLVTGTIGSAVGLGLSLMAMPDQLLGTVQGVWRGLAGLGDLGASWSGPDATRPVLAALAAARSPGLSVATPATGWPTASEATLADLRTVLRDAVTEAHIVGAARLAAAVDYPSAGEAEAVRRAVSEALDAVMLETSDPAVYARLAAVHAAVVRDLTVRAGRLPRLRTVTVDAPAPALALAHGWWGDDLDAVLDGAADIVDRNRIRHPLFTDGTLEVLDP
ncbi:DNA circularization protein [Roseospira navarrensis]|uniref:DNA circulation N-terminal domain-containing protein n=1 Tax=Roseospira navarrensis TaxID=140058 RepID=A0A7X1ZEG7_9PROT|nr:DNA circularization N-terminal domain-containing protein [Roseospira navarrensis]MQX36813.1 hypothetical protein [Roseospira navarrensis]